MSIQKNLSTPANESPVFENRNKAYGAYQLRRSYEKRLTLGLLSTVSFFLLALWGLGMITPSTIKKIAIGDGGIPGTAEVDTTVIHLENLEDMKFETDQPKAEPETIPVVTTKDVKIQDTTQHKPAGEKLAMVSHSGTGGAGTGSIGSTIPVIKEKLPLLKKPEIEKPFEPFYDVAPSYPGGTEAYQRYVNDHISSSVAEMAFGASGKIVLNLSIDEEGNVVNVEVVKGINSIYDREVVRVLKTTKWNPGTLGGKPARVKCGTTILVHM